MVSVDKYYDKLSQHLAKQEKLKRQGSAILQAEVKGNGTLTHLRYLELLTRKIRNDFHINRNNIFLLQHKIFGALLIQQINRAPGTVKKEVAIKRLIINPTASCAASFGWPRMYFRVPHFYRTILNPYLQPVLVSIKRV